MKQKFTYVCIPEKETDPIVELQLEYEEIDEVSCLMNKLRQHYAQKDKELNQPNAQNDPMRTLMHLTGQVPLLNATKQTEFIGISLYIADSGKNLNFGVNKRASDLCSSIGKASIIYGDAFIAKYMDDGNDLFQRLDFTLKELDSSSAWFAQAKGQVGTPSDLQYQMDQLKKLNQQAPMVHKTWCGAKGCPNEGKFRCARCKKVFYCSAVCQRKDWPSHKPNCK